MLLLFYELGDSMKKLKFIFLNFENNDYNYNFENYINVKNIDDMKQINTDTSSYFCFLKKNSIFENVDFEKIINFMEKEDIKLYALMPCDKNKKKTIKISNSYFLKYDSSIKNLYLDSFIIKSDLLKKYDYKKFDERFFLSDILELEDGHFQSCDELIIKNDLVYSDRESFDLYLNKSWYLDDLKSFINKVNFKNQNYFFNLYLIKLLYNIKAVNNSILNENDLQVFEQLSKTFLNKIDDELINVDNIVANINIDPCIVHYLFSLKYGNKYKLSNIKDSIYLNDDVYVGKVSNTLVVKAINFENNKLHFYCLYDNFTKKSNIKLFVNGLSTPYQINGIYSEHIIFGKTYYRDLTFDFYVDLNSTNNIYFETINSKKINLSFPLCGSRLVTGYRKSYWNVDNYCVVSNGKMIKITNRNFFSNIKNEVLFDLEIIKKNKLSPKSIATVLFRLLHFICLPFNNKDIWITYDKLYKGGDCGEYFYRYVSNNTKQKIYYIVNKGTNTYNELVKKYNTVLSFGSLKCMLLSTYASNIFETEFTAMSFCGFKPFMANLCKGIFNADIHCIQHGLTMQRISNIQNKLNDNLKYYFIASKYEEKNLLKDEFGYKKEDLVITGIPRFDGLKNNSQNIIMLAPTWRVDLASKGKSGEVRGYIKNFKSTNYYKILNSLINNKKLLKTLKEMKYKIKFVIHPCLISNIIDYEKNDSVEIVSAADINYEDVLTSSKLMITDYSGVQYDFAYMNKPIIYYHNDDLPPSYNDGEMIYEKIGFGDIAKDENTLVNLIINMIKNDCQLTLKYKRRINDFFMYRDYNCCKRIYEFIKKGK